MSLLVHHLSVLRDAQKSPNFEELVTDPLLRKTINEIIEREERAREQKRESQRSRYWSSEQKEELLQKYRAGGSLGELADHFKREPKNVEDCLVSLKEIDRSVISRSLLEPTVGATPDKAQEKRPKNGTGPKKARAVSATSTATAMTPVPETVPE